MMKSLKIIQIVGILMLGIGIGIGYQEGGSFMIAALGLVVYSVARLTAWVQDRNRH